MAREAITMEQKLAAVLARASAGYAVSVSDVCVNLGISRQTYYRYRRRFEREGLDGLAPRSRRPLTSPSLTPPSMVESIVRARKELGEEGWDVGAISVRSRLLSEGHQPPAVRTIHRVLVRSGVVQPQPAKRPRSSYRRFQFPATDDCWQIDAFEYRLSDESEVVVFELIDDHSRYLVGTLAWPKEDSIGAWTCLARAIDEYGKPRMLLSDNGLAFNGKRMGVVVLVERNLIALGIRPITARPHHPQTTGKDERLHQTTRRWLAAQPRAETLAQLQDQLDRYRHLYNHDRPHQSLDGQLPAVRRLAGIRRSPDRSEPHAPTITRVADVITSARGDVSVFGAQMQIGIEYALRQVTVFKTDGHVLIFYRHHLVRELIVDPSRRRQAPPRPRGNTRVRRAIPDQP